MVEIQKHLARLDELGAPREDSAMGLPLGMETRIVCKHNLRNLMDMSRQRMCSRAYHEYRALFSGLCRELSGYSEEWDYTVSHSAPNAPGQRDFSRCTAPFFLEIRQYSCEKMSCLTQKFLAAGHIGRFQLHPNVFMYPTSNVTFAFLRFCFSRPRSLIMRRSAACPVGFFPGIFLRSESRINICYPESYHPGYPVKAASVSGRSE